MDIATVIGKLVDAGSGKVLDRAVDEGRADGDLFAIVGMIGGLLAGGALGSAVATPTLVTPAAPAAPAIAMAGAAGGAFVGLRIGLAIDTLARGGDLEDALAAALAPIT